MRKKVLEMSKLNMSKVIAKMSNSVGLVHASLVDSVKVTDNIHKVIVSFNTEEATAEQKYLAIANLFDNNASPIEKSFRELSGTYKPTACGFICVNVESKPFTQEMASSGKYQTLAGNCMIDKEDESLWEVTSSGNNKYLVRKSQEDLSQLVSLASLKNQTAKYQKTVLSSVINKAFVNDYIAYVDKETATVKYGYVLADLEAYQPSVEDDELPDDFNVDGEDDTLEVLDSETQEPVNVEPELVVESAFLNGDDELNLPNSETASQYDSTNKSSMKEYYKQLYSHAPEYYAQLEKIIDGHAVV